MAKKDTDIPVADGEIEVEATSVETLEMPAPIDTEGIVIVKQAPLIEEHLQRISDNILQQVAYAKSLECTEENKQEIKKLAQTIQKQFNDLEEKRKEVKKAVNEPYKQFEDIYKKCVTEQIKPAITQLRTKIAEVEDAQKKEMENKARAYFEEYRESLAIDFVSFEDVGITIILSKSLKHYKGLCKEFLDKVASDIQLINTQDNADDIMVEYKKTLDCSGSIIAVKERYAAIEEEKRRRAEAEERAKAEAEHQAEIKKVMAKAATESEDEMPSEETFTAPTVQAVTPEEHEDKPKEYYVAFGYYTSNLDSSKEIKEIMEREGRYEQL